MKRFGGVWRVARALLLGVAALVIFIEEWGWRPLSALAARIARWPPIARLEATVVAAPPRIALVLFLAPAVMLVPVKLAALWLIGEGRTTIGIVVIVVAKVLGTALVGRLFVLVEPQLQQFAWFARVLVWWRATRERVMTVVRESRLWRGAAAMRRAWRLWRRRLHS